MLQAVREAWTQRRGEVEQTAAAVRDVLARTAGPSADRRLTELPSLDALADAAERAVRAEDAEFGGFASASAPMATAKFPMAPALRFLQSRALCDAAPAASDVAVRALDAMAAGSLRDAIDGGFFRYATRRDWTTPHYERMLTDNAGLLDVALDAGRPEIARGIAGFLTSVLQQPAGGFGAAQDSESWVDGARSEGGYYAVDAAHRAGLEPPKVDAKIVTGWNGLAIGALARAGLRLGDDTMVESARWAADAVLGSNTTADGMLRRASLDELPSQASAALEDYGLLADALTSLAAATGEVAYATVARRLVDACIADGIAVPGGGDPVLRLQGASPRETGSDGDHPSGRASLAAAAVGLWLLGAGEGYREAAASIVRAGADDALAEPLAHGALLAVAARLAAPPRQLVVVTESPADPLVAAARKVRTDITALVTASQSNAFAAAGFELFTGKQQRNARSTAYDCLFFVCRLPTTEVSDLES